LCTSIDKYTKQEYPGHNIPGTILRKQNEKGTHFSIKDNNISMINIEMVLAILPQPILIQSHRKFIYEFSRTIDVKEK